MQAHSVDSCFFIKAHQITDLPLTPPKRLPFGQSSRDTSCRSQPPDVPTDLQQPGHPLLQHGAEHHHSLQQPRALAVSLQAFQPPAQQGMLDLDQTQHVV